MIRYVDSSVLVAALVVDEPAHVASLRLLREKRLVTWSHALAEVYSTLTGGRLGVRASVAMTVKLIDEALLPRVKLIELSGAEMQSALHDTENAGERGGGIFDFLHYRVACKAGAKTIYTLNERHFLALIRESSDPKVEQPR
jgi:predicted nucleic acid-binding protein